MRHHFNVLFICLSIATLCFIACALGLLTSYQQFAVHCGMVLVGVLAIGLFYATLHLQKVH